jgi:hypothetical protein
LIYVDNFFRIARLGNMYTNLFGFLGNEKNISTQ